MISARAAFFTGCLGLFSASTTALADDVVVAKPGDALTATGRRRAGRIRLGPTTVTVIDEGETVHDVISRVRERRARKLLEPDPGARPGGERGRDRLQDRAQDRQQDRRAALREKLRTGRDGRNDDRPNAGGPNAGGVTRQGVERRTLSPSAETRRERMRERAAERVGGDRPARPRREAR